MNDDRLAFILRAPALVERVVRGALRQALRARRYQSGALEVRTFANAALGELGRLAESTSLDIDAVAKLELQNATVSAAGAFASSAVARRLFSLPAERLRAAPPQFDAVVLDARDRLHVVRLELVTGATARGDLARAIGRSLPGLKNTAQAAHLHLLSLRDGRLRSFGQIARERGEPGTLPSSSAQAERYA